MDVLIIASFVNFCEGGKIVKEGATNIDPFFLKPKQNYIDFFNFISRDSKWYK